MSPLDWGIGHATRCVPIIRELQKQGARVVLGASGMPLAFLQQEFPELDSIDIPGHPVRYARRGASLPLAILMQTPGLIRQIRNEHKVLPELINRYNLEGVVSDNRFGMYSDAVPSVFITHQVFIKTNPAVKAISPYIIAKNIRYIKKFRACWIPDLPGDQNLSGKLSHGNPLPENCRYVGPLSRFKTETGNAERHTEFSYKAVAILSGPEPQRSVLEEIIRQQAGDLPFPVAMVLGKPGSSEELQRIGNLEIFHHLPSRAMKDLIQRAETVIARSGYSTVMDLVALRKKAILIPTPGQPEQEYLGEYLTGKGLFRCIHQETLQLKNALQDSQSYGGTPTSEGPALLRSAVEDFMSMI